MHNVAGVDSTVVDSTSTPLPSVYVHTVGPAVRLGLQCRPLHARSPCYSGLKAFTSESNPIRDPRDSLCVASVVLQLAEFGSPACQTPHPLLSSGEPGVKPSDFSCCGIFSPFGRALGMPVRLARCGQPFETTISLPCIQANTSHASGLFLSGIHLVSMTSLPRCVGALTILPSVRPPTLSRTSYPSSQPPLPF